MLQRIAISPRGEVGLVCLAIDSEPSHQFQELAPEIRSAFQSNFFSGLVALSSSRWKAEIGHWPGEFRFWRDFARTYFSALCRQYSPTAKRWATVAPPDTEQLEDWLFNAPVMPGREYLKVDRLQELWRELDQHTHEAVRHRADGVAGFLKTVDEDWNLIGRVTFHLAENKKNHEFPFAFMATFTQGQSKEGAPLHLSLADALRDSIDARDSAKLDQLLEPVRRAAEKVQLVDRLLESKKLFSPQAWKIEQAFQFLKGIPEMEHAGLVVRVPNWWNAARPPLPQVSVNIGSQEPSRFGGKGLDLQVGVTIDGEPLSEAELKDLLASRDRLVLLKGKWVQVDQDKLSSALSHWKELRKQHVRGVDFLQAMKLLSGASIGSHGVDGDVVPWVRIEPGEWLEKTLKTLRAPDSHNSLMGIPIDPNAVVNATLRHYQTDGVRWLWFATQLGLGVCLADDMGLGKTLQIISLISLSKEQGLSAADSTDESAKATGACLIVIPTSLLGNWQREFAKFAPNLNLFVAHRAVESLERLKAIEADPQKLLADMDVVLVTYGALRNAKWLSKLKWKLIVLDEAQAIKNAGSLQAKAIKAVPAQNRIVMTGTPVENNLGDLWSLFDFCSPGLLGTAAEFKRFVSSKDESKRSRQMASLRKLIQPYVLRRMKTDPKIAPDLPAKTEMRVDCNLSSVQAALYQQVTSELKESLDNSSGMERRGLVLAALMQLKQICNHPALFMKGIPFDEKESGKFAELRRLCESIAEKQEKVLVFSQFQSMCGPLSEFLQGVFGRSGVVLTGQTKTKARAKLVEEFQQAFGPPFFVISVKAGGTGLNLTEASHVIHFDRWWNPAVEDQATDRAFRIGQRRNVMVHKFVTAGTLEDKIDELIQSKRELSNEMFDDSGELKLTEMSNEELLRFVSLDIRKAQAS